MYVDFHAKYSFSLSDYNEIWNFSTDFRKIQISRKSNEWESRCSMRTDRQTDRHDEPSSCLSQFSNVPKNKILWSQMAQSVVWLGFWLKCRRIGFDPWKWYRVVLQHVHTGCGAVSHKNRGCGGAGVISHQSQLAKIKYSPMELHVYSPLRYLHGGVLN
jgi:hypothetical protein